MQGLLQKTSGWDVPCFRVSWVPGSEGAWTGEVQTHGGVICPIALLGAHVLVSSCAVTKRHSLGGSATGNLSSHHLELEAQGQGAGRLGFCCGLSWPSCWVLTTPSLGEFLVFLPLILLDQGSTLITLIASLKKQCGVRASTCEFGGHT